MTKRRKIISTAAFLMLPIGGVIVWLALQPGVLYRASHGTGVLFAKIAPIHNVYLAMRDHERATGQVPRSIQQFTDGLEPVTRQRAREADNTYARAVLLHDVQIPSGATHKWMLVLLIPKGGRFAPPNEDLIYVSGSDDLQGEWHSVNETEQRFGQSVVQAAYEGDHAGRERIATQPATWEE